MSPILIGFKVKIIPNYQAKEKLFMHYFRGWQTSDFQKLADRYSANQLIKIIKSKALERINWHKQQGHKVVIVSASIEYWLIHWCTLNNLDLIGTKLEILNDKITGKFASKNCYGMEKVIRIKQNYDLTHFSYIYAYGDSKGDREMLNLANESFYRPFK